MFAVLAYAGGRGLCFEGQPPPKVQAPGSPWVKREPCWPRYLSLYIILRTGSAFLLQGRTVVPYWILCFFVSAGAPWGEPLEAFSDLSRGGNIPQLTSILLCRETWGAPF